MSHAVVFSPEAQAQLIDLYHYIAAKSSPDTSAHFTEGIVAALRKTQHLSNAGRKAR
jgi:toxin ParE1/3/4